MKKSTRYSFAGLMAAGLVSVVSLAHAYPAIDAAIWPSFYGMEYAAPRIVVDQAMQAQMRADLLRNAEAATSAARSFYGTFHRRPYLVACSTEACDHKMGGRGPKGMAYTTPLATVIRLSPRDINETILTHEFSHVELGTKVSLWAQITGAFPIWFDEDVAVVVSDDSQFLNPGASAAERCVRNTEEPLPTKYSDWGPRTGKDPMLYADAACRVLQWMEANGGTAGLLKTLNAMDHGMVFTPENRRRS